MTSYLQVGESVSYGPGTLLNRPELAALIGCACAEWAYVEELIGSYYSLLMGVYLPYDPEFEPPIHPVAIQVMDELQSVHAKINLLKKLSVWVIKDEVQRKEALEIFEKLRKAGTGRNKVAHGVWGICMSEPDALILIPAFGHKIIYKKQDFELIIDNIQKARTDLGRIFHNFYHSRRAKNF